MSDSAFQRYAPFIKEFIYRKGWTDLREVQVEACNAILDTDDNLIIASGTASGKTEAAFFPILTLLKQDPPDSIGVLYIGPLKALINDQFSRLNELLEESYIPVWSWHGDVSQSKKAKALKTCEGVLQITPESLEALLMRHPGEVRKLFSDLRFIIIDEIHSLMGEDRGLQVLCLISRLEKLAGCNPRRIGLSATLNDYELANKFLSSGSNRPSKAVGIKNHARKLSLCVQCFDNSEPNVPKSGNKDSEPDNYSTFIYDVCHNHKCLIFTNSRSHAEEIILDMKRIAASRNEADIYYVHHGSVSAVLRQEAEHALKESNGPAVAAATLTLELGIDIGDLDLTVQLGAPFTCSSFVQRLGRSGRRTGKSQMMFVCRYKMDDSNPYSILPWSMLQSIAIIQLYLEKHWVEPFYMKPKPFSLLAHQTLSTLMTYGELSPSELARKVLLLPPFSGKITQDEYKKLLKNMLDKDFIQRIEDGGIIVGLAGEKITNFYKFYAVFQEEELYTVSSKSGEIGTLANCPSVDEVFILAGRAWKTISVDEEHKRIYVKPSHNTRIPMWMSEGGDIAGEIVQRMKQILSEDIIYPYLLPEARELLYKMREYSTLTDITEKVLIPADEHRFYYCPWTGTKTLRTIYRLLSYGLKDDLKIISLANYGFYIEITTELEIKEFLSRLKNLNIPYDKPELFLRTDEIPQYDKYDYMVPDDLLKEAFLYNELNVPAAVELLTQVSVQ